MSLDREKARNVLRAYGALQSRIVEAFVEDLLNALEACIVPDQRIARIEGEIDRHERETRLTERGELHVRRLRAILRGES